MSSGFGRNVPGPSENVDSGALVLVRAVEQLDRVEADLAEHEHRHQEDAAHQQHGLDDLYPGRRHHAAEDDVAEHERAGQQHGEREVDADELLDQHARADHLRDQVEGHDGERAERRGRARRGLVEAEREHVGDRVLARVAHPLGEQEHHREERDEESDRVQEPVEPVQEDEAGDAEERGGREIVAGDREAVLAAGDLASGGVEADRGRGPLGGPEGDAERDREDDRRHHQRFDVDLRDERHRVASGVRTVARSKRDFSSESAAASTAASDSGSYSRSALRRYQRPSTKTIRNWVSA